MLAQPLAQIYQVEPKAITRAVKRNPDRFPDDFRFELSEAEWEVLRYQNGTANWEKIRFSPYGFSREGANMLSTVLRSKVASERAIQIMRAFSEMERKAVSDEMKRSKAIARQGKIEWQQARLEGKVERLDFTEAIKGIVELADEQNPENNAKKYYVTFTNMVPQLLFNLRKNIKNLRDELPASALRRLQMVESVVATWINEEVARKPDYHEPYTIIKERTKALIDVIGKIDLSVPA
jgi:lipopolysaccharide biosynthesis regulator YciM